MHVFKKYTNPINKQQLSRSVEQLADNVHPATSVWLIYIFWIGGIPQSIVYIPLSDKFTGYQFILHSRPTSFDRGS